MWMEVVYVFHQIDPLFWDDSQSLEYCLTPPNYPIRQVLLSWMMKLWGAHDFVERKDDWHTQSWQADDDIPTQLWFHNIHYFTFLWAQSWSFNWHKMWSVETTKNTHIPLTPQNRVLNIQDDFRQIFRKEQVSAIMEIGFTSPIIMLPQSPGIYNWQILMERSVLSLESFQDSANN